MSRYEIEIEFVFVFVFVFVFEIEFVFVFVFVLYCNNDVLILYEFKIKYHKVKLLLYICSMFNK